MGLNRKCEVSHEQLERALEIVTDAMENATDGETKLILMGAITAIREKQARDDDRRAPMCDDSPCVDCKRGQCPTTTGGVASCAKWRFWFRERWPLTVEQILHGKKRKR